MSGKRDESRRKLIGLMYLVLTVLLALNVSKEVLKAFNGITQGLQTSLISTNHKIDVKMELFSDQVEEMKNDAMARVYLGKANAAKKQCDSAYQFIESLKELLVEAENNQVYNGDETSFLGSGMSLLVDEENTDVASRFLSDPNTAENAYGEKLKSEIHGLRSNLKALISDLDKLPEDKKAAYFDMIVVNAIDNVEHEDLAKRKWEYETFNNVPLGAAIAILTKLQTDIKSTEAGLIDFFYDRVGGESHVVEKLVPIVNANSASVTVGDRFDADIFLAAQIKANDPEIYVDGERLAQDGATGKFSMKVNSSGAHEKKVLVKLPNPKTGKIDEFTSTLSFNAYKTQAIVSPLKMNVVYKGLKNPISVSVPGYNPDDIITSVSPSNVGRLIKRSDGLYDLDVANNNNRRCKVMVGVRNSDGSVRQLEPIQFRIRTVPKPMPSVNRKNGGSVSRGFVKTMKQVDAHLDETFLFDGIKYKVVQFSYIYKPGSGLKTGTVHSNKLPKDLRDRLKNVRRDDMLIINRIYAETAGVGRVEIPGSMFFTVN